MTNEEEIRVRLGWDATAVSRGTAVMMDGQKKAAMDYAGFWKAAIASREEAEIAADVRSAARANRLAVLQRERAIKQAASQAAINAEIAAGSGGFGSGFGAGAVTGGIAGTVEGELAGHGGGGSTRMREAQVLVREISAGRWSRVLGSLSIFLGTFGGKIKSIIASLFGAMGLIIGAFAVGAYAVYRNIKEMNASMDDMAKEAAKSIGDSHKAMIDSQNQAIEKGVEYQAFLETLAEKHESVADAAERAAKAVQSFAKAEEGKLNSFGNARISYTNVAEHMGMMSPESAAAQRSAITLATFRLIQATRHNAMVKEGDILNSAYGSASGATWRLKQEADATERAAYSSPAALARVTQMHERDNIAKDIKDRQEKIAAYDSAHQKSGQTWTEWGYDQLRYFGGKRLFGPKGKSVNQSDLMQGERETVQKEQALLKAQENQNQKNIEAQKQLESEYIAAKKKLGDNNDSVLKLKSKLDDYAQKVSDAGEATKEAQAALRSQIYQNKADQIIAANAAGKNVPTVQSLAGREFMARLGRTFGRGGKFDLNSGSGPYAGIAQDYEYYRNLQQWQLQHGYGKVLEDGTMTGAANVSRLRSVRDLNMLQAVGLETPAMQMKSLIQNGIDLKAELKALNAIAGTSGIIISDNAPGT